MRVFGIDPGSDRTGYGCIDSDGRRHHMVLCGAVKADANATFPEKLAAIHRDLTAVLLECHPDCVAIENLFHAVNVRSALKLGHARGVAMLAAVEAGVAVVEYTPAEIKRAVVGYGRAEKSQVQQMVKLLLGLEAIPTPHDAADALAIAICHLHMGSVPAKAGTHSTVLTGQALNNLSDVGPGFSRGKDKPAKSWRDYRPPVRAPRA